MNTESKEKAITTYYVYFFVEKDFFKVGVSKQLHGRYKIVAFNSDLNKSFSLGFNGRSDAYQFEKIIHWMFRGYRLNLNRSGGTEFFKLECLDGVIEFIENNEFHISYCEKLDGDNLLNAINNKICIRKERMSLSIALKFKMLIKKVKSGKLSPTIRAIKDAVSCNQATAERYRQDMLNRGVTMELPDGTHILKPKLKAVK